ncbi:hypothetical protein ASD37_03250 [Mycobacterium sp. Root135]|uniref:DUF2505 domain-containing protein n=1 Tax=Mycobacterium sp. Root135 TaxID=1736457 RepID=UPI0006F78136|nr:DUF2505 domain-containing protein [Mycobacterium sp. Root135]KQY09459.1 hypothetical protein ASD37_03250 [Mycobacterium sp. Root135]
MLRSLPLTAESPHPLESIKRAFEDPAYWTTRLGAFEGGSPTLDSLDTDASGLTRVSMTMRFGGDQLPDPIRRLRLASLEIVQCEEWYPVGGTVRGEITVDAPRTPLSGRGAVELTPDGPGTHLTGTATVKVNVPLIGGTIATFVAGQLANGIVDVVAITDAWLSRQH